MRALFLILTGCNLGLEAAPPLSDSGSPPQGDDTADTDDTDTDDTDTDTDTDDTDEECFDDDNDGVTTCDGDCNDGDSDTFPGAAPADSGAACMTDSDGDGYGADNPANGVTPGTDCNDANPNFSPGEPETAFDGVDSNCDGEDGGSIISAAGQGGMAINDNSTINSTASVSGCPEVLALTIGVTIQHTYIGDLQVTLSTPGGQSVLLHNGAGGSASNIIGTYSPTGGSLTSAQSLVPVLGTSGNGQWRLTISDGAGGDTGTLSAWSVDLECP
jgi:hypothetical protein